MMDSLNFIHSAINEENKVDVPNRTCNIWHRCHDCWFLAKTVAHGWQDFFTNTWFAIINESFEMIQLKVLVWEFWFELWINSQHLRQHRTLTCFNIFSDIFVNCLHSVLSGSINIIHSSLGRKNSSNSIGFTKAWFMELPNHWLVNERIQLEVKLPLYLRVTQRKACVLKMTQLIGALNTKCGGGKTWIPGNSVVELAIQVVMWKMMLS